MQLYTIHGVTNNWSVPLVYALMTRRTLPAYRILFQEVKALAQVLQFFLQKIQKRG
jgi:hypothetical protein